jgi:hypothetical protein
MTSRQCENILASSNSTCLHTAPVQIAALRAVIAGNATDTSGRAIAPFYYGRWDATTQAHHAAQEHQQNPEAAAAFNAEGAFDPDATRAALRVLASPVLFLVPPASKVREH